MDKHIPHIPDIPPITIKISTTEAVYAHGTLKGARGHIRSYRPFFLKEETPGKEELQ